MEISQKIVAFSEYMNFIKQSLSNLSDLSDTVEVCKCMKIQKWHVKEYGHFVFLPI